jgi:hypothetical protein
MSRSAFARVTFAGIVTGAAKPRRLLAAATVFVALLVITPSSALASHVECGDVITHDTTLDADVVCDPQALGATAPDGQRYAILIGADDVRLDLAGHRIVVPPAFQTGTLLWAVGIYGHDRVTIANGEPTETVALYDAHDNRLVDLVIDAYIGHLILDGSRSNQIRGVRINGDHGSTQIRNGSDGNIFVGNDFVYDIGVYLVDSDRNLFLRNTSCSLAPFAVEEGSDENRLEGNVAGCEAGQAFYGFRIANGAQRNVLVNNTANAIGLIAGIFAGDPSTVLINNTANDNVGLGILAVPGVFAINNRASGNGDPRQCVEVICR